MRSVLPSRFPQWRGALEKYGPLIALFGLILIGAVLDAALNDPGSRRFLSAANFLNILRQNSFVGIVAVGMTFVIILGGIDLSVGSIVALSGALALLAMNRVTGSALEDLTGGASASPRLAAAGVAIITGIVIGWLNGLIIAKGKVTPFIATLGSMAILRSLTLAFADGGEIRPQHVADFGRLGGGAFQPFGADSWAKLSYPVTAFLITAAVAHLVLTKTRLGLKIHAIGDNEKAAEYSGLHIDRVRIGVYTISGFCCGLAGLFLASRLNSVSSSNSGVMYELNAIAAVVVGGTNMRGGSGRVWGTVVGVLLLGVVDNLLNMISGSSAAMKRIHLEHINMAHLQGLVKGAIIIAAVLVQKGRK